MTAPWWRDAVVYEIYVRSFADANGDGVGDLQGVRSRLDHLADLGVDALWLTPFYKSPMADGGYDVADYRDVDPRFGSLEDFDALLHDAHARGIRLIVDIVPNHTSSEHPWFAAGLRDRYVFRPGSGADGELPPNDWQSVFGGPAWTQVEDGSWYLHMFAPEQPDLNWRNPEVVAEFADVVRFWLDRGVDGFRIDVAMGLFKHPDLPDLGFAWSPARGHPRDSPMWGRPEVHDVYRQWRRILNEYDAMAVGEVWADTAEDLALYLRPDELHQVFNFLLQLAPWSATEFRQVVEAALAATPAPTWVLSSHDAVRHPTRYGGSAEQARAALLFMLSLPGSAYLYQGEELGLPQVTDLPVHDDPIVAQSGKPGRDGCRVPIPWAGATPPFGFTTGEPWLPLPADWKSRTADAQEGDPTSMLSFYRAALRARKRWTAATTAPKLSQEGDVLTLRRGDMVCVTNFGSTPVPLPPHGEVLLATTDAEDLPGGAAAWLVG